MDNSISTIIVDDEPLARQRIRKLLQNYEEFAVVDECKHGEAAVHSIINNRPDLVFLDIQMPKLNGFEVIQAIGIKQMPAVIFVTAFDKYALKAFDVNAVDYLLKPFDRDRFESSLDRVKKEILLHKKVGGFGKIENMLSILRRQKRIKDRILIKCFGRVNIVELEKIDWIKAAGNYVEVYVGANRHLLRETMHSMEKRLQSHAFARAHRQIIVNLARVKEIRQQANGNALILLHNGKSLPLSRRFRGSFDSSFNNLR
jgi:two-component system LytT family response regulator